MKIRITTPDVQWGNRKTAMMRQDILRFLAQNGAGGSVFEVVKDESAPPAELPPKYLKLRCKSCGVYWFWVAFTECPVCEQKATVHKMVMERVHLPAGLEERAPYPMEVPEPVT